MNIYLLTQSDNTDYNTYDSCVVCAESEEDARLIHPSSLAVDSPKYLDGSWDARSRTWAKAAVNVTVEPLGKAKPNSERGCVCASFNAG